MCFFDYAYQLAVVQGNKSAALSAAAAAADTATKLVNTTASEAKHMHGSIRLKR